MAWLVYEQLLRCPDKVEFRGVLCLGRGTNPRICVVEVHAEAVGGMGGFT